MEALMAALKVLNLVALTAARKAAQSEYYWADSMADDLVQKKADRLVACWVVCWAALKANCLVERKDDGTVDH